MARLLLAVALGVFAATSAVAQDGVAREAPTVSPAALHAQRQAGNAPLVVDVRTPEEYASGHIPGAVNIPFDQVTERLAELQSPHGVALYCMLGPRARKGEAALLAAGHDEVLHLDGGLAAWQQAGLPVETEP